MLPTGTGPVDALDLRAEPPGQPHAALLHADQDDAVDTVVALEDLVGHAGRRPPNVVGCEHPLGARRRLIQAAPPSGPHGTRFTVAGEGSSGSTVAAAPSCGGTVDVVQFEDIYRRELRTMIALGTSLTGSREAGVDLAHEAMLRAYRVLVHGRLDGSSRVRGSGGC